MYLPLKVNRKGFKWLLPVVLLSAAAVFPLYSQSETLRSASFNPRPEGKIVTLHGSVQYAEAGEQDWKRARILHKLYVKDRVKTLKLSRASILLKDETQIRLNANAELTIKRLKKAGNKSSVLELVKGEGWFRTKNPKSRLEVHTPTVTAAIRGSEIDLKLRDDGTTTMTVLEGEIDFYNEYGSLTVLPGEQATVIPGKAPVKRKILNPEDAVQWVLFYPVDISWHDYLKENMPSAVKKIFAECKRGNFEAVLSENSLSGGDWVRIGIAGAWIELGQPEKALVVLNKSVSENLEDERLSLRAAALLLLGKAGEARKLLERALSLKDDSLRTLTLLSTVELIQNNKEKARKYAERAVKSHPESVSAGIAAGEVYQAFFDLQRAGATYDRVLKLDPESVRGLVNRARILFGSGKTEMALRDIKYAGKIKRDNPQVLSLSGFIKMSRGSRDDARADFEKAVELDSQFGEPHLGLGLIQFREGKKEKGLEEILIATLLQPKISLYQSYLAKGYHQLERAEESLSTLKSAEKLDPLDPTPRLYASLFLQDSFRFVDALDKMHEAIALNDNRAVYRSRLLLDKDLATKSVSMARVYRELGFDSWGMYEAHKSLNADFANPSVHLFLADLYGNVPDRLQAQGSELLQYLLYIPVNRNVFSTYKEYTVLFDVPFFSVSLYSEASYPFSVLAETGTRSGSDYFAHLAFLNYRTEESARPEIQDRRYYGYVNAKASLGNKTDLLLTSYYTYTNYGSDETEVITVGTDTPYPLNIRTTTMNPDSNYETKTNYFGITTGLKHTFGIASPLTLILQYELIRDETTDPDVPSAITGILLDDAIQSSWDLYDTQVQQVFHLGGRNQLVSGLEFYYGKQGRTGRVNAYYESSGLPVTDWTDKYDSDSAGVALWLWDRWQLFDWLHITAGLRMQKDVGKDILTGTAYDFQGLYPLLGFSFDFGNSSILRTAVFQRRNTRLFGDKISPTTVEGFVLERNEPEYVLRTEFDVSWELSLRKAFFSTAFFYRYNEYPEGGIITYNTADHLGLDGSFDWIITNYLCASVENQLIMLITVPFVQLDNVLKSGLTFTFPFGLKISIMHGFFTQNYLKSSITELKDSLFQLVDCSVRYTFPGKRGTITISGKNILNQDFEYFIEGLSLNPILPYRRIKITLGYRF
ncbi:MAG: tetratricopeptide repeat protein [Spirochaetes bacterium]|nr:tetratricopeptide repeat protein [Spirochaetota bacterium]